MYMLNKKGFILMDSIVLFQIVIILIMVISASTRGLAHIQTTKRDHIKDEDQIREIFDSKHETSQ